MKVKGKKCAGCKEVAKCIIRTKYVCRKCYNEFKEDNLKRHKKGLDIPNNLELLE